MLLIAGGGGQREIAKKFNKKYTKEKIPPLSALGGAFFTGFQQKFLKIVATAKRRQIGVVSRVVDLTGGSKIASRHGAAQKCDGTGRIVVRFRGRFFGSRRRKRIDAREVVRNLPLQ